MQIFLDSTNIQEIQEIQKIINIDGVTTNPSLMKNSQTTEEAILKHMKDKPVSIQFSLVGDLQENNTWKNTYEKTDENLLDATLSKAKNLVSKYENSVIKLPISAFGLAACKLLSQNNIKTNMTLCFSAEQALLCAKAGATYVSPFVGRLGDYGGNGLELIEEMALVFQEHNIQTQIIAASIRTADQVKEVALLGADIATIPPKIVYEMISHKLTDIGLEKFSQDAEETRQQTSNGGAKPFGHILV